MERGRREDCVTVGWEGPLGGVQGGKTTCLLPCEMALGGSSLLLAGGGRVGADLNHTGEKPAGWEEQSGVMRVPLCFPGKPKCCSLRSVTFLLITFIGVLFGEGTCAPSRPPRQHQQQGQRLVGRPCRPHPCTSVGPQG